MDATDQSVVFVTLTALVHVHVRRCDMIGRPPLQKRHEAKSRLI